MRLLAYTPDDSTTGRVHRAVLVGNDLYDLGDNLHALDSADLARFRQVIEAGQPTRHITDLTELNLAAPIPPTAKIIGIGLNYRDHAIETGQPIPEKPIIFAKFANTLTATNKPIELDGTSNAVDYEAEFAFVIGRRAYRVSEADAMHYVAGYANANDVSARDLQFETSQWVRGKTLDTFCPIGPFLVTKDEVGDPHNLGIRFRLNGQVLQNSNTAQLIFNVPQLLSHLSQGITLEPGDVVLTGTPSGVGNARNPKVFLKPGDVCEVEIDGLGTLVNPVVAR